MCNSWSYNGKARWINLKGALWGEIREYFGNKFCYSVHKKLQLIDFQSFPSLTLPEEDAGLAV